jgi:hypothetical protein
VADSSPVGEQLALIADGRDADLPAIFRSYVTEELFVDPYRVALEEDPSRGIGHSIASLHRPAQTCMAGYQAP